MICTRLIRIAAVVCCFARLASVAPVQAAGDPKLNATISQLLSRELLQHHSRDTAWYDELSAVSAVDGSRTDDRTRVLDAMSYRARRTVTDIARRSGMSATDVQGLLGLLALEGAVVSTDTGWRRCAPA